MYLFWTTLLLAFATLLHWLPLANTEKTLVVCPPNSGCVEGKFMPGYQIEKFEAFLGIPFAYPPLGSLRFENPVAMPKWDGIRDATEARPECIQKNYLMPIPKIYGEEDCLYLNVYRPVTESPREGMDTLPVMVYIHGGGFFSGSANPSITGPEYFMDTQQVILVTMSYRLGALGFLSTQDANIPGNFGLKDQHLALNWVQQNIEAFGGSPLSVTLFGQSAGGLAAHMHMISSMEPKPFHRVISMSGTANVPFAIQEKPLEQARKTAELCNIRNAQTMCTNDLASALRKVDVEDLLRAGDGLKFWDVDHLTNYRAVVEPRLPGAFLTEHPKTLIDKGSYPKMPWLLGTVPGEGAVRLVNMMENTTLRQSFNARFDELLQKLLEFPSNLDEEQIAAAMVKIVAKYFQNSHELNDATYRGFEDLITDRGFKQPLYNIIWDYAHAVDTTTHPFYVYSFNFSGIYSYSQIYTTNPLTHDYGVVHCDDLLYLFRSPLLFPDFDKNSVEAKVVKTFVDYFVSFAKTGKVAGLGSCILKKQESRDGGICDYLYFVNNETNSFEVEFAQSYPVSSVNFWNELLNEKRRWAGQSREK